MLHVRTQAKLFLLRVTMHNDLRNFQCLLAANTIRLHSGAESRVITRNGSVPFYSVVVSTISCCSTLESGEKKTSFETGTAENRFSVSKNKL